MNLEDLITDNVEGHSLTLDTTSTYIQTKFQEFHEALHKKNWYCVTT